MQRFQTQIVLKSVSDGKNVAVDDEEDGDDEEGGERERQHIMI